MSACAGLLHAQKWTPADLLLAEQASQFDPASGSKSTLGVKTQMDKEEGESVANLFLSDLTDGSDIQLTRGTDSNTSPKFSPTAKQIAFLSTRRPAKSGDAPQTQEPSGTQVWLMNAGWRALFPHPVRPQGPHLRLDRQ